MEFFGFDLILFLLAVTLLIRGIIKKRKNLIIVSLITGIIAFISNRILSDIIFNTK